MPKCFQLLAVLQFRSLAIGMRVFVEEVQALWVKSLPFITSTALLFTLLAFSSLILS